MSISFPGTGVCRSRMPETMEGEELRVHASNQFRRMYRYGLALLLAGALCNWIGFAQNYFAPIRYLGVGCVLAGVFCICVALCRWLALARLTSNSHLPTDTIIGTTPASVHVITVPVQQQQQQQHEQHECDISNLSKPPDYETIAGSLPPSYEEAVRIAPAELLHQQQQQQHQQQQEHPPPYPDAGNQSQSSTRNTFWSSIARRLR